MFLNKRLNNLILIVLLSFFVYSCDNDDDDIPEYEFLGEVVWIKTFGGSDEEDVADSVGLRRFGLRWPRWPRWPRRPRRLRWRYAQPGGAARAGAGARKNDAERRENAEDCGGRPSAQKRYPSQHTACDSLRGVSCQLYTTME